MVKRRIVVAALLALPVAPQAFAQYGGGRRAKGGESRQGGEPRQGGEASQVNQLEVTLREFQEDLKLTASQQRLWESYAEQLRALANDVARERAPRRTTPQVDLLKRIDQIVDLARNRVTALEEVALSARSLYAALAPEQQVAADPRLANVITLASAASAPPRK